MSSYRHLMLDLETLGTRPGCVIRSVGAVLFDFDGRPLGPAFYANITEDSCRALGLWVDPIVAAWWGVQSAEAREALDHYPVTVKTALDGFARFIEDNGDADQLCIWSHGATFDIPIIEAAMLLTGSPMPWRFKNFRDTRTMIWLAEQNGLTVKIEHVGISHNAID